jgi:ADP-ribose pyrophosphatase YjhB (NUDIX family)
VSVELLRHVNALVADLAADHGRIDLVGRRCKCSVRARAALRDRFESYGVVGGAGVRAHGDRGVLLVRYEPDGEWLEPGAERRPGESYRECARRAFANATGIEATLEDLPQVHVLYMDDGTGRPAVPNPYLVFDGRASDGRAAAGPGVAETRWVESPPSAVGYAELAELSLPE